MYPHQVERLTAVVERRGFAALVATTPVNIAYLTGFRSLTQEVYGTGQLAVWSPRGSALVVPGPGALPLRGLAGGAPFEGRAEPVLPAHPRPGRPAGRGLDHRVVREPRAVVTLG